MSEDYSLNVMSEDYQEVVKRPKEVAKRPKVVVKRPKEVVKRPKRSSRDR